jgi:hypothetical protein
VSDEVASVVIECFVRSARQGKPVPIAYSEALAAGCSAVVSQVSSGKSWEDAVGVFGAKDPEALSGRVTLMVERLRRGAFQVMSAGGDDIRANPHRRKVAEGALYIIVSSEHVRGVPTIECIHKHLPADRDPTEAELHAAWKQCST